jgi:DNA-binding transcriptional LysR family regulator
MQMKCFISLVNTKKQVDTANIMGVHPSTLSKYIEHMESEFAAKMFVKTANGLDLTKEGRLLYPRIQFMMKKYEDLITEISGYTSKWPMKINVISMFHQSQIIKIVNDFLEKYPYINLSIEENTVSGVQQALDKQTVDAAIIYKELLPRKFLYTFPIKEVDLVAVVNKDHPLAKQNAISVSELKDERFILFKGDFSMYSFLLHTCISADFVPNEMDLDLRMYTIMEYLCKNNFASLLMRNVVENFNDDRLVAISLKERPRLTMSLICPTNYPSQASEKLIDYINSIY